MNTIAVLVLAAGKSSRMKEIKQLLKVNNKTLLDNILETSKKVVSKNVFCILGANADKIKKEIATKDVQFIYNKNFESGLSSSIVAGIHHFKKENLNFDGVLILLADQPEVDREYLTNLTTTFQENRSKIIASNYNHKAGVPAIFPHQYFKKLLLLNGDKGAKVFLENHLSETIILKRKQPFKDIDTPKDYESYLSSL